MPAPRKPSKPAQHSQSRIKILVLHGPNLDLLGTREVTVYGKTTLKEINTRLKTAAARMGVDLTSIQSNHEGKLVDLIGKARHSYQGILINPAAYTHTSVALRDALLACGLPAVEIHLSNIYKREEFRQRSLTAAACIGLIAGFGMESYILGLEAMVRSLKASQFK